MTGAYILIAVFNLIFTAFVCSSMSLKQKDGFHLSDKPSFLEYLISHENRKTKISYIKAFDCKK